jgi:hypothetical protein
VYINYWAPFPLKEYHISKGVEVYATILVSHIG